LNFRILRERDQIHVAAEGLEADGTANYHNLVQHDELFRVMNEGICIIFHSAYEVVIFYSRIQTRVTIV